MLLFVSQGCGKDLTMIEKDTSRVRYLSPEEGVDYGLIDKVLYPQELRVQVTDTKFFIPGSHGRLSTHTHTSTPSNCLASTNLPRRRASVSHNAL
jgi:Clp protease